MTDRKFYKRVYRVEILSESPIPAGRDLEDVLFEATEGDYSGAVQEEEEVVLTGAEAAKELIKQRSDPDFFGLTDDGEDVK